MVCSYNHCILWYHAVYCACRMPYFDEDEQNTSLHVENASRWSCIDMFLRNELKYGFVQLFMLNFILLTVIAK